MDRQGRGKGVRKEREREKELIEERHGEVREGWGGGNDLGCGGRGWGERGVVREGGWVERELELGRQETDREWWCRCAGI